MRMRWLLLALCLPLGACRSFSEWVSLLGFTEIRAPSTLYAPGSLLLVESKEPYQAQLLCDVNEVLGKNYRPTVSRTVTIGSEKKRSRTLTFNVDAATLAGGNVDIHAIKSVKVQMKDPRILMVTHSDVFARRKNLSASCWDAINALKAYDKSNRKHITLVQSVLAADASYSVEWDDRAGLDVQAKVLQLQNLAADLRLDASHVGTRTLSAQGVYWGIKDSLFLASLLDGSRSPRVSEDARLMSPEDAVDAAKPIGQEPPAAAPLKAPSAADVTAAEALEQTPATDPRSPEFVQELRGMVPYDPGTPEPPSSDAFEEAAGHAQEVLAPSNHGAVDAEAEAKASDGGDDQAPAPRRPISPRSRSNSGRR